MQNIGLLTYMMNWHSLSKKKKTFDIDIFNFEFNKIEELKNSNKKWVSSFIILLNYIYNNSYFI